MAVGERRRLAGGRRTSFWARVRRDRVLLLLTVPGLVYFLLFYYVPLLGNVVAFEEYLPFLGFVDSPFVGVDNFVSVAQNPQFWQAVLNTLEIAVLQLVFYFPAPLGLALLLNGLISTRVRRIVQSIVYLPHFISWVIIVAIFQQVLGGAGVFDQLMREAGMHPINIMTDPALFKPLVTAQAIWKDTGWGTIIFLAALANVDASLYEAAAADGAGRWRRMWHVTLPGVTGVIILLLILRLGNILSVGFEQILLQRDAVGATAAEVLDTYVYYHGIVGGDWGTATAVGLVKGVVGAVLVLSANRIAHAFGQSGVYE